VAEITSQKLFCNYSLNTAMCYTYITHFTNKIKSFIFMVLCIVTLDPTRCNSMQGIYLLQNHSTCFVCPSHPSSGVQKTVTAASGTGYIK